MGVGGVETGHGDGGAPELAVPLRVGVRLDRRLDVLRREGPAAVELHVVAQVEGDRLAVVGQLPGGRQSRRGDDLVVAVTDQRLEDEPDHDGDAGRAVGEEVAGDEVLADAGGDPAARLRAVRRSCGRAVGLLPDGRLAAGGDQQAGGREPEACEAVQESSSVEGAVGDGHVRAFRARWVEPTGRRRCDRRRPVGRPEVVEEGWIRRDRRTPRRRPRGRSSGRPRCSRGCRRRE